MQYRKKRKSVGYFMIGLFLYQNIIHGGQKDEYTGENEAVCGIFASEGACTEYKGGISEAGKIIYEIYRGEGDHQEGDDRVQAKAADR